MTDFVTSALSFISAYGLWTALGLSVLWNTYITLAWVKREKHLQLVEIGLENLTPKIKFELNKDEKFKAIATENIGLKAENQLLRNQAKSLPIFILLGLLIATSLSRRANRQNDLERGNDSEPTQ
ncbi:hypothetical protein [Spirosoma areae]